jgi:putative hydrolase of the HAD superfamily
MSAITHVFFDIGGVLGTNGWDSAQRKRAIEKFGIEPEPFQLRHEEMVGPLETGEVTLDEYLDVTVFCRPRDFTPGEFKAFMLSQSEPDPEAVSIAREVARGCNYWVMTLNNESDELNRHRIETFGLADIFDAYLSSCWLGLRKPSRKFYVRALQIAQADPRKSVFIDDREHNITAAQAIGMRTIHFSGAGTLREELARLDISLKTG